jgi:hypothetical protein
MRIYDVAVLGDGATGTAFYNQLKAQTETTGTSLSERKAIVFGVRIAMLTLNDEEAIQLKFISSTTQKNFARKSDGYLQLETVTFNPFLTLIYEAPGEEGKSKPVVIWDWKEAGRDANKSLIDLKNALKPIYDQREQEEERKEKAEETEAKAAAVKEKRKALEAEAKRVIEHLDEFNKGEAEEKKTVKKPLLSSQFREHPTLKEIEEKKYYEEGFKTKKPLAQTWQEEEEPKEDIEVGPKGPSYMPTPKK